MSGLFNNTRCQTNYFEKKNISFHKKNCREGTYILGSFQKIYELEQYGRRPLLPVAGIPETADENTSDKILEAVSWYPTTGR